VNDRAYFSIGDVLSLLREEFPDITISKIRFLESRGLLIPERTPSGYRKFYDHDVDRLRWILRQQRENFLPLKVIKGRLEGQEPSSEPTPMFEVAGSDQASPLEPVFAVQPANGSHGHVEEPPAHATVGAHSSQVAALAGVSPSGRVSVGGGPIMPAPASESLTEAPVERARPPRTAVTRPASARIAAEHSPSSGTTTSVSSPAVIPAKVPAVDAASRTVPVASGGAAPSISAPAATAESDAADADAQALTDAAAAVAADTDAGTSGGDTAGAAASAPATARSRKTAGSSSRAESSTTQGDASALAGASLTAAELAQASGLDAAQIEELESYGLIESRMVAGVSCFDEEALVVAGLAAGFARFGVEARHLKMFKHAAERQAGMYSQIVMPLLRQRNPDARRRAHDDLTRLAELGASVQACFAKAVLRDLTRG
jgi:DNA-binding transcriptional MerR regulator